MCNIMLVIQKKDIDEYNENELKSKYLGFLENIRTRGRDRYTLFNPKYNYKMTTTEFSTFMKTVQILLDSKSILLHARAIPETEVTDNGRSTIYTSERFAVAHHGTIVDAEKYNPKIIVDSELLLDIYKDVDYTDIQKWFISSLEKYPRSTTEIIYDRKKNVYIIATNFMPLYKYEDDYIKLYSTYKVNDEFYQVDNYKVIVEKIEE